MTIMSPAEVLDLLGSEARTQLCDIAREMLDSVAETTVVPTALHTVFVRPGPELNARTWYDLLRAAAEVVSEGWTTIRRANSALFTTEVLGPARYVAVLPAEGAPERVTDAGACASLYYSSSVLRFRRDDPSAA